MNLVQDQKRVRQVTTSKGWIYRVVEGSFSTEVVTEQGNSVVWFTFEAHGKRYGTAERVAIRQSDVKQIVESAVAL